MRRRRIDQTDYSGRVAATRLRIARERLGIPTLEAELKRMQNVNMAARVTGETEVFHESVIEEVSSRLRALESEARISR